MYLLKFYNRKQRSLSGDATTYLKLKPVIKQRVSFSSDHLETIDGTHPTFPSPPKATEEVTPQ